MEVKKVAGQPDNFSADKKKALLKEVYGRLSKIKRPKGLRLWKRAMRKSSIGNS